jgi:hypothetical protein
VVFVALLNVVAQMKPTLLKGDSPLNTDTFYIYNVGLGL